ncbi:hypothetical protein V6N11_049231 [Hibiscus sabdariffa]|uniref:Uncharacterized protein n=2 Tax=Hibiscus sabdariffa TaxID=183260 RepID=A0ABR2AGC8_9ROSI
MGERSNRAGEGVPHHLDEKSRCCSDIDRSKRHFLHWMGSGLLVSLSYWKARQTLQLEELIPTCSVSLALSSSESLPVNRRLESGRPE